MQITEIKYMELGNTEAKMTKFGSFSMKEIQCFSCMTQNIQQEKQTQSLEYDKIC